MGVISRGVRNAFRNLIRTISICIILGISIALALVMLLSMKAVEAKIASVKSSIGNQITVTPAGAQGFEGGGEPLVESDVAAIKSLPHVTAVNETLNDRLTPQTDTSLNSPIDPGTLGQRAGRGFGNRFRQNPDGGNNTTFSVPIRVVGTSDPASASGFGGGQAALKSGNYFDATKDVAEATVGQDLATKNSLVVGSTFQAYNTTIKVDGIFDSGSQFANDVVVLPIKTLQRLSTQTDQVSSAQVQVDSIDNLDATVTSIKDKLGTKADVVSQQDTSKQALAPLENVKNLATYSLFGTVAAGAIIIFLAMLMIVRERRREIGIFKALGASNLRIISQFVVEAVTLTFISGVLGFILGFLLSNPILGVLINNSSTSTSQTSTQTMMRGFGGNFGGGFARFAQSLPQSASNIRSLTTSADLNIILLGVGIAFLIAIAGSIIPAWLISKVRPAEVLRNE